VKVKTLLMLLYKDSDRTLHHLLLETSEDIYVAESLSAAVTQTIVFVHLP